jgi:hypothetical protein
MEHSLLSISWSVGIFFSALASPGLIRIKCSFFRIYYPCNRKWELYTQLWYSHNVSVKEIRRNL